MDDPRSKAQRNENPGSLLPQYVIAIIASIGGIAAGSVMGWSANAGPRLLDGEYDFEVSVANEAWISSISGLGAAVACYPMGYLMERFGRRLSLMCLVLPSTLGWLLIILAQNVEMLIAGRFIIGISMGCYCVVVPVYNSEIAQDEAKGPIGTIFQIMFTSGILLSYCLGYAKVYIMSMVLGLIPIFYAFAMLFLPETPYYWLKNDKRDFARDSYVKIMGVNFDPEPILNKMQTVMDEERANSTSLIANLSNKASIRAMIICLGVMVYLQFSGINPVIFNATAIFTSAGADIPPKLSTIIIGCIQMLGTFLSTFGINRLGRKPLLYIASAIMGICDVLLGVYFYLKEHDPSTAINITWLPLMSLCIFFVGFSMGHGPISWLLPGELCLPNIKAFVSSSAVFINWFMLFVLTRTFSEMQQSFGEGGAFWFFAGVTFTGIFFVYFVMVETKGKSLDEIQLLLKNK